MPETPLVSVVICTRNRAHQIANAVKSVLEQDVTSLELNVIDQSDTDATEQVLLPFAADPRFRYTHTRRVGLSAARNRGAEASSADIVAFTDDDCVAPPDWLSTVLAAFDAHPGADLMYGEVLVPEELKDSGQEIPFYHVPETRIVDKRNGFVVTGMGANFAARRRLLTRLGGFDDALGMGGPLRSSEDFDLTFRTFRAGASILLEPSVQMRHYGVRSQDQWPATLKAYGIGDGAFYMKHARCGDFYAASLFVRRLTRQSASVVVKRLRGRSASPNYPLGLVQGAFQSFRFPVDRRNRKYVLRQAP